MKGQASQIFIYIVAIVIVGAILVFGYSAIVKFKDNSERVVLIKFQKDIETSIKSISNQYGTIKEKRFSLSNDFIEVCFLRNENYNEQIPFGELETRFPLIVDTIDLGVPTSNIFLIGSNDEVGKIYEVGRIDLAGGECLNANFCCHSVNSGILTIKLEGKGDHVVIS